MWLTWSSSLLIVLNMDAMDRAAIETKGKGAKGGRDIIPTAMELLNQWKQALTLRHFVM